MRVHLYEFRSDTKRLKCVCGWERTLKTSDPRVILETFNGHYDELAAQAPAPRR